MEHVRDNELEDVDTEQLKSAIEQLAGDSDFLREIAQSSYEPVVEGGYHLEALSDDQVNIIVRLIAEGAEDRLNEFLDEN